MDIVDDIFLFDKKKGLLTKKYQDLNINIKKLSKALPNDEVTENIDNDIEVIISLVLCLKRVLKTPEKVKEYIKAVLIEIEENKSEVNQ